VRPVGAVVSAAAAACAWQSCRSVMAQDTTPPQIPAMLIDVHAHFYHDRTLRADWRERNASRLRAGERIGITTHVASILGSFGRTSPTYFPSPADLEYGNNALIGLEHTHPDRIRGYVTVNPNYATHARVEIQRGLAAGAIGNTRLPPLPASRTSPWICRAAAWTAACSRAVSRRWASSDSCGARI